MPGSTGATKEIPTCERFAGFTTEAAQHHCGVLAAPTAADNAHAPQCAAPRGRKGTRMSHFLRRGDVGTPRRTHRRDARAPLTSPVSRLPRGVTAASLGCRLVAAGSLAPPLQQRFPGAPLGAIALTEVTPRTDRHLSQAAGTQEESIALFHPHLWLPSAGQRGSLQRESTGRRFSPRCAEGPG